MYLSIRRLLISILAFLLGGCAEVSYYSHTAGGQLEVLAARQPIHEVIADPGTPPKTRRQLQLLNRAREFAVQQLALPDTDSFHDFADLERKWVLWNVFATPPLSLEPHRWCYPMIGCQNYRSFFSEEYAIEEAENLRESGLDVYVAPSPAYSTRGWFSDPVYAPMLRYNDVTLVGILFHELAHERVYFESDSELNESFAVAVQNAAVKAWLQSIGKPELYASYREQQHREREFTALVLGYRDRLQALYDSDQPEAFKHAEKIRLFNQLRHDYRELRTSWGTRNAGHSRWASQPLNNARMLPVVTYRGFVEAFHKLFRQHGEDWPAFFQAAEQLAALPKEERRAVLLGRFANQALRR